MKKLFLMMVAAMAMTMVSCNGTAESGSNNADSTATEASQAEGPKTLDKQSFTVTVPEGWTVESESDDLVSLSRAEGEGTLKVSGGFMAMDKKIEDFSTGEYDKRDDLTVNDVTYKVFEGKSNGLIYIFTEKLNDENHGTVEVMTYGEPLDGASLKALLESLKLK